MAPTAKPKAPSFMAELIEFAGRVRELPYERLSATFLEAGWLSQLREVSAVPAYNGTTLITFDLYIGKSPDAMERFDQLTMSIAPGPGPVSIAARLAARESVIYMISGRLPPAAPQQPAAPAPEPRPNPSTLNGRADNAFADGRDEPPEPASEQEYVQDDVPRVNVISHREPDGLPIFRDLYAIGLPEAQNTGEIIDAALDEVTAFLAEARSIEQITALGAKNLELIKFFQDLGTEEDVKELRGLIEKRRNELNRPVGARRRVPAAPRAN